MTTLYKLTNSDGWTRKGKHNACLWGPGVTHTATGNKGLGTSGVIHAYRDPLVAVLMGPVHGGYGASARMWEAKGEVSHEDATKVGCRSLTTVREVSLPEINNTQRIAFGILCAMQVCNDPTWADWAKAWLSGEDRSSNAALAAAEKWAAAVEWAAAWAAAAAAAWARAEAATWAALAAEKAAQDLPDIDLSAIAQRAMEVE